MKETDLHRLCAAISSREGDDETADWKIGAELRDNLSSRMNTYGLVMALLITLTFGQDQPDIHEDTVWSSDQVLAVQSWYVFFLYTSSLLYMVGIMCVVEILDRLSVTPVFLVMSFMEHMGAHSLTCYLTTINQFADCARGHCLMPAAYCSLPPTPCPLRTQLKHLLPVQLHLTFHTASYIHVLTGPKTSIFRICSFSRAPSHSLWRCF